MVEEQEHLADVLDQASRVTQMETNFLIADSAARAAPKQVQVPDAFGNLYYRITECVDCGDDLEPHRLPSTRCIFCQEKLELKERNHAHP